MQDILYITSIDMGDGLKKGAGYISKKESAVWEDRFNGLIDLASHAKKSNEIEKEGKEVYFINKSENVDVLDVDIRKNNMSRKVSAKELVEIKDNYVVDKIFISLKNKDSEEDIRLLTPIERVERYTTLNFKLYFDFDLLMEKDGNLMEKNNVVLENRASEYLILRLIKK